MRVHRYVLLAIVLLALVGSVVVGKLAGDRSETGKEDLPLDASAAPGPADIRGWMTLQEVSDTYGVPLTDLYTGLDVPADLPATTPMKDLESTIPDFETEAVRLWVSAYQAAHPGAVPAAATPVHSEGAAHEATPAQPGVRLAASQIKGHMTLAEIAEQCQVPVSYLLEQMKQDARVDLNQAIKGLAEKYGFEVGAVRAAVSEYQASHP